MPDIEAQQARVNGSKEPAWVMRSIQHSGLDYEGARQRCTPFERLVDEELAARSSLARLCVEGSTAGKEVYVIINNKAEGSAPLSAFALAAAIAAGPR